MKHNSYLLNRLAVWSLAAMLAGCSSVLAPIPDKSKFFLLTPIAPGQAGAPAAQSASGSLILGLGPIKLPAYLDRTEVVTQVKPNRLEVSEINHWAEPLKSNFTTVLGENLSTLLGTAQIVHFPWYSTTHLDYQLVAEVQRFDSDAQGNARLIAQWTIENPSTKKTLDRGESDLTASGASDADRSAVALSRVLADFSRQLATAIGQVNASGTCADLGTVLNSIDPGMQAPEICFSRVPHPRAFRPDGLQARDLSGRRERWETQGRQARR